MLVIAMGFKSFENIKAGHFVELVRFKRLLEGELKWQLTISIP